MGPPLVMSYVTVRKPLHVRFGSLVAAARPKWDVRFAPESCRGCSRPARQLRAISRRDFVHTIRPIQETDSEEVIGLLLFGAMASAIIFVFVTGIL